MSRSGKTEPLSGKTPKTGSLVHRQRAEIRQLRSRLADAEETVRAIRAGEVDALVLHGAHGEQVFTLKGAERSYRLLVETMSEGAATFGEDGTILYCNTCFARMVGVPMERVMGASMASFIAPADTDLFSALARRGRMDGARAELSFAGPSTTPCHVSLSPLRSDDGSNLLCMVATDLSAQKRSADMLGSERLASSVIEQATDAILVCDVEGRIIRASRGVAGYVRTQLLFSQFSTAFPSVALRSIVVAALAGTKSQGVAAMLESDAGQAVEVLASGAPLLGPHGTIVGAIVTITDVSHLKHAQRQLENAVQVREQFLAIASHELRTPLMALQLQLDSLQIRVERERDAVPLVLWSKKLEIARRQAGRLATLADAMLDISRLNAGHFKLELEEFDLTDATHGVVDQWSAEADRAGCELRFHKGAPSVGCWDRLRMEQAVANLISNATKYAAGKPVDVTVDAKAGEVWIVVEDRGIGIEEKDRGRIFESFERAVPGRHYGGLGLGLYITRQIAEAAGGSIDVDSTPGLGSTFRVRLPIRAVTAVMPRGVAVCVGGEE